MRGGPIRSLKTSEQKVMLGKELTGEPVTSEAIP